MKLYNLNQATQYLFVTATGTKECRNSIYLLTCTICILHRKVALLTSNMVLYKTDLILHSFSNSQTSKAASMPASVCQLSAVMSSCLSPGAVLLIFSLTPAAVCIVPHQGLPSGSRADQSTSVLYAELPPGSLLPWGVPRAELWTKAHAHAAQLRSASTALTASNVLRHCSPFASHRVNVHECCAVHYRPHLRRQAQLDRISSAQTCEST